MLLWSTGRLGYEDEELVQATIGHYVAITRLDGDTDYSNAPKIGSVSQMLKGCVMHNRMTPALLKLFEAQAEAALGDGALAAARVLYILDNYNSIRAMQLDPALQHYHHRHMARLETDAVTGEEVLAQGETLRRPTRPRPRLSGVDQPLGGSRGVGARSTGESQGRGGLNGAAPDGQLPWEDVEDVGFEADDRGADARERLTGNEDVDRDKVAFEVFRQGSLAKREALQDSQFFRLVCSTLRALGVTFSKHPITSDGVLCDVLCEVEGRRIALQLLFDSQTVAVVPRDQVCCTPISTPISPPSHPLRTSAHAFTFEADGVARWYKHAVSMHFDVVAVEEHEYVQLTPIATRELLAQRIGFAIVAQDPSAIQPEVDHAISAFMPTCKLL